MTIQLYSIEHAPASVPVWHSILEDLANPPARRVARVLGIGLRTVRRYNQTGRAPRSCLLALFWLTRWGRSAVHAQATNDALVACGYVEALRRRVDQLEAEVVRLVALDGHGAANDPRLGGPHA